MHNIINTCSSTVYVMGKASHPQEAVSSYILGSQKLHMDFRLHRGSAPLTPVLSEGHLEFVSRDVSQILHGLYSHFLKVK